MKYIRLSIRITEEHHKILKEKARQAGYTKVSDYIRITLFRSELDGEEDGRFL